MWIYNFLSAYLPTTVAKLVVALWFAILILLVLVFAFVPQAEFRYGNI